MLLSTLAFTVMNGLVKHLIDFGGFQLVFFRAVGSLLITFSVLKRRKIPIWGNNKKILIYRGLAGVISMTLFFNAIQYIPVGTAVSLRYIAPIFAVVFAVLLLKEKVVPVQWLFFAISFFGVIVLKGFDVDLSLFGVMLVVLSAVFTGLVFVIINKIGDSEHPVVVVNYFMLIATIVGGVASFFNWKQPNGEEWLLLLSLGIFGYFGQLYMTKAFQMAPTSVVAPFKYVEVVFVIIMSAFWFKESYALWSLLGIGLILLGLLLNVFFKSKKRNYNKEK